MSGNVCRCGAYPQIVRAVAGVLELDPSALDEGKPFTTGSVLV
jgi:xanthine dehydrogenase YagT iron-sulfur-binding subunit